MADETRRCIGSKRFGIEPHDAPVEEFPKQPSQKDGLGRMCRTHWNQYTAGLAREAKARKADEGEPMEAVSATAESASVEPDQVAEPKPRRPARARAAQEESTG